MIRTTIEFITAIQEDLKKWDARAKPWFRGESGCQAPLCPKIAKYTADQENHFVQTFRRKAGGLANTPHREDTDMWLFLAQHYGLPTRLLDWTEGALLALYFAINKNNPNPRVYMLNPHRLNELATGIKSDYLNYPLTWGTEKPGYANIALAWEYRNQDKGFLLPVAIPATYQDHRMIAQRSCFTVHGEALESIPDLLRKKKVELTECLIEYLINNEAIDALLAELTILGVSASTIFPDLDNLAKDMILEIKIP